MDSLIILLASVSIFLFARKVWIPSKQIQPNEPFSAFWKAILIQRVTFYNSLTNEEKKHFEFKINDFLINHKITGINVQIDITDKLLVAASAVIPIFAFPGWRYNNLSEVLLYPDAFNENFEVSGPERRILGMVGTGYMEGKMILSKPALHLGFSNESDKRNTAIHEFVHLIDKSDGTIDGIPVILMEKQYAIPWLKLIDSKIEEIYANRSDVNPYGGTNRAEFFAVISEYFFERPKLLSEKHPELYKLLEDIFDQKLSAKNFSKVKINIGRNTLCPCDSGLKFKKCCGKII